MAMFVLVYFKDDEKAKDYVRFSEFKGQRVVGVYKDPRHEPCSCGPDVWRHNRSWSISKLYGWPVHNGCGRVSKTFRAYYGKRMFAVFGRNLLPVSQTPKMFQDWKQQLHPRIHAFREQERAS